MNRSNIGTIAKHIVVLFIALFAIALITRMPALFFANIYALHGMLSAAFFAAVLAYCLARRIPTWQFCVAVLALACILGLMSPVMGVSFALVAACALAAVLATAKAGFTVQAIVCGVIVGLVCYLAPVAAGVLFGSFAFAGGAVLQVCLLALASALLGAAGAMISLALFGKDKAEG